MSDKQLIGQLEQIESLYEESGKLLYYIDNGAAQDALGKVKEVHADRGEPPKAPSVFAATPVFPIENKHDDLQKELDSKKLIFFGVLGFTALMLIIYFLSHVGFFNTLSVLGIFATIFFWFRYSKTKKDYFDKKHAYDRSVKEYNISMEKFRTGLARYEQEKEVALRELEIFRALHAVSYDKYIKILDEFAENKQTAIERRQEVNEQLRQCELVPENYLHLVSPIITILKSGRADTYKEALNLAIDEERQEQEAAARRAAEARRQAEEERRTAILQQQAAEERRHNEQMERQQAEQARQAARQAEQAQRQAEQAQRQARREAYEAKAQAERDAYRKCASCRNGAKCSPSARKHSLTCGGYSPR